MMQRNVTQRKAPPVDHVDNGDGQGMGQNGPSAARRAGPKMTWK